jgi:hypothetical protein
MAGYAGDIVDAAGDPVITVLVAPASVPAVRRRMGLEVGVDD